MAGGCSPTSRGAPSRACSRSLAPQQAENPPTVRLNGTSDANLCRCCPRAMLLHATLAGSLAECGVETAGTGEGGGLTILERTEISARIQSGASRSPKHLNRCRSRRETPCHFAAAPRKRRFQGDRCWLGGVPASGTGPILALLRSGTMDQAWHFYQSSTASQARTRCKPELQHPGSCKSARGKVENPGNQGFPGIAPSRTLGSRSSCCFFSCCRCCLSQPLPAQLGFHGAVQPTPSRVKKKRTTLKDCKAICLKMAQAKARMWP